VILKLRSGATQDYVPSDWLARPPFNVELRTLHIDRTRLDRELREIVLAAGVNLLRYKVVQVERKEKRVTAVVTQSGIEISSPWFLDASGSGTSLFPRLFDLPVYEFGPRKVVMWDYFSAPELIEGTTLHADCEGPFYMSWVWQIPVHANTVSVCYVAPGGSSQERAPARHDVPGNFQGATGALCRAQSITGASLGNFSAQHLSAAVLMPKPTCPTGW
jgi:flavin-dependent dehydrogenase